MYATEDEFRRAVAALAALIEDGAIDLLVLPPFARRFIKFVIPNGSNAVAEVAKAHGLSERDLTRTANDVADVLSGVVSGVTLQRFVSVRTEATEHDKDVESREIAEAKYGIVRDSFDIPKLAQRHWVKQTAKTDVLYDLEWEVAEKAVDNEGDPPGGQAVPLAVVKLSVGPNDNPLAVLGYGGGRPVLTLDEGDVDAMLHSLRRLKEALQRRRGGQT
jgi:hypothetical protein